MSAQRDLGLSLLLGLAVSVGLVLTSFVTDVSGDTGFALALGAMMAVGLLVGDVLRPRAAVRLTHR